MHLFEAPPYLGIVRKRLRYQTYRERKIQEALKPIRVSSDHDPLATSVEAKMADMAGPLSSAIQGLVEGLEAGTEECVIIEVEKIKEEETIAREGRRERERVEAERRKNRDEKTAFWTTPGLRPLAEPPILDEKS